MYFFSHTTDFRLHLEHSLRGGYAEIGKGRRSIAIKGELIHREVPYKILNLFQFLT